MCNLSEGIVDRTREEVTREVTQKVAHEVTQEVNRQKDIGAVRKLMTKMGWSIHQAMDVLDIPKAEQKDIAHALAES